MCQYILLFDFRSLQNPDDVTYPLMKKGMGMADIKKKFGTRLFQLRNEAKMTQAQLAEKADLSVDSISRMGEVGDGFTFLLIF